MELKPLKAAKINDIENLILLSDDVLNQLMMNVIYYDENGNAFDYPQSVVSAKEIQGMIHDVIVEKSDIEMVLDESVNALLKKL